MTRLVAIALVFFVTSFGLALAPAPPSPTKADLVGEWKDSRSTAYPEIIVWHHNLKADGTFFSVGSVAKEMWGTWELKGSTLTLHRAGYHWNFQKYYGPGLYGKKAPNAPLTFPFHIGSLRGNTLRGTTLDPEGQGKPKMQFTMERSTGMKP